MHQEEEAGRLVDVHDAVCADSVLLHQPAQLDEEPMRVGVRLLRAVELLQAQAHATQKPLDPALAETGFESLCVEPFIHQSSDRHRAEAQNVGHLHVVWRSCSRPGCQSPQREYAG